MAKVAGYTHLLEVKMDLFEWLPPCFGAPPKACGQIGFWTLPWEQGSPIKWSSHDILHTPWQCVGVDLVWVWVSCYTVQGHKLLAVPSDLSWHTWPVTSEYARGSYIPHLRYVLVFTSGGMDSMGDRCKSLWTGRNGQIGRFRCIRERGVHLARPN